MYFIFSATKQTRDMGKEENLTKKCSAFTCICKIKLDFNKPNLIEKILLEDKWINQRLKIAIETAVRFSTIIFCHRALKCLLKPGDSK